MMAIGPKTRAFFRAYLEGTARLVLADSVPINTTIQYDDDLMSMSSVQVELRVPRLLLLSMAAFEKQLLACPDKAEKLDNILKCLGYRDLLHFFVEHFFINGVLLAMKADMADFEAAQRQLPTLRDSDFSKWLLTSVVSDLNKRSAEASEEAQENAGDQRE